MKKVYYRITALFLAISVLFIGFPFQPLSTVKASSVTDNFVDFLRTNLGMAKISSGSLEKIERYDFYKSLYNTPLVWTYNGEDFNFVPSSYFNSLESWITVCNPNNQSGSFDPQFVDFDIKECLIKSGYIRDTGSGYDLSDFPKLDDFSDTVSPLDGLEIITNFSNYNPDFNHLKRPYSIQSTYNSLKNYFLSLDNRLIIYRSNNGNNSSSAYYYYFISPTENIDYFGIYKSGANTFGLYYHNTSSNYWGSTARSSALYGDSSSSSSSIDYLYTVGTSNIFNGCSSFTDFDSSVILKQGSAITTFNYFSSFWGSIPVIIGSDTQVLQNYYYWMKGIPDGSFYSTANTGAIYNYDYVTNNNWETAYNNYITDVSNYYSTTENITNEKLSQYIDNSTNITYITNNYIDNSGSGGDSGGGSVDSGILASWLERIFDRVTDIYYALIGQYDSGDIYYNDNSIRYSIIEYPLSDLFPSVPQSAFIPYSDIFDFGIAQNHLNNVMRQIIPFCYLYQLQTIATALASPPQAPHYEIPFVIDRLNIDEQITIDLTSSAWSTIHSIWITLFMIMLIFALLYATYKFLILLNSIFG